MEFIFQLLIKVKLLISQHTKKKFEVLGSAHNLKEVKIKEKQGCTTIFLSPLFKVNKSNYYLDVVKFNILANNTDRKIIALGGINFNNLRKN